MRKRIGIFVGEILAEYQKTIMKSVFKKAEQLNYDVFAFCSYGAYGDNLLYAEGEENMMLIPDLNEMAGIIVCEDTFDIIDMNRKLENLLKKVSCPVVYLKTPKKGFYNVLIENTVIMEDITRHFIKEHGFRDICYMSGKREYADARERQQGFLNVMKEAGIEITEHMIYEGDYWREKGKEALDWFMTGRTTYPQAIICANDYMALSICIELKNRGIKVPEQVCVSGFDNIEEAKLHIPSLTTVEVPVDRIGTRAVEVIDNVCNGRPQKRVEMVNPLLIMGESCGCGTREIINNTAYMLETIYSQHDYIKRIVFMTTDGQDAFSEDEILRLAEKYATDNNAEKMWICFNKGFEQSKDEELEDGHQVYTDEMVLIRYIQTRYQVLHCHTLFPRQDLLPEEYLDTEKPQAYLVFSIHHRNQCYGYMVMTVQKGKWVTSFNQAFLMVLSNAIEDYRMHQEVSGLEEIRSLYLKDPLTGIYNRRGFEKKLRILNEIKRERPYLDGQKTDKRIILSVVSIDMDGLKYINDNFGHAEGDEALKRLANVIKNLAKQDEVYARTGGDEFSMVLISDTPKRHEEFEDIFLKAVAEEEKKVRKPYPFHASIGVCCITEKYNMTLMKCIQVADEQMYAQKRRYKQMLKENIVTSTP